MELVYVLHPHTPETGVPGWRWAVHYEVHPTLDNPLDGCLNAGFDELRHMADLAGQTVLYTVHAFAVRAGIDAKMVFDERDYDVIPAPLLWRPS